MVTTPETLGAVYMTEHVEVLGLDSEGVHLNLLNLPPAPPSSQKTIPRGLDGLPLSVSVTVAVRIMVPPADTVPGFGETVIVVDRPLVRMGIGSEVPKKVMCGRTAPG